MCPEIMLHSQIGTDYWSLAQDFRVSSYGRHKSIKASREGPGTFIRHEWGPHHACQVHLAAREGQALRNPQVRGQVHCAAINPQAGKVPDTQLVRVCVELGGLRGRLHGVARAGRGARLAVGRQLAWLLRHRHLPRRHALWLLVAGAHPWPRWQSAYSRQEPFVHLKARRCGLEGAPLKRATPPGSQLLYRALERILLTALMLWACIIRMAGHLPFSAAGSGDLQKGPRWLGSENFAQVLPKLLHGRT